MSLGVYKIIPQVGGDIVNDSHGATWQRGWVTEELLLSTAGATSTTTGSLLPANSVIESVVAYVTKTIGTATDWKLGDSVTAGRFTTASTLLTSGLSVVGTLHLDNTSAAGPRQVAAAAIRVTLTGTPTTGRIRITSFYRQYVPPTS